MSEVELSAGSIEYDDTGGPGPIEPFRLTVGGGGRGIHQIGLMYSPASAVMKRSTVSMARSTARRDSSS